MSDTDGQTTGASEGNQETGTSTGGPGDGATGGTQAPEGFVSREELTRVEQQRRDFQSENDRLKSQLDSLTAASATPTGDGASEGGTPAPLDVEALRRSIVADVHGATALASAASSLRTEFPYADSALFTPEKLAGFGSPEALRLAVQDSHLRVADLMATEKTAIEERLRQEYADKLGNGSGAGNTAGTAAGGADPTVEQLASMTTSELDALEAANPGVVSRILRSATE